MKTISLDNLKSFHKKIKENYSPINHTHNTGDINGLPTSLPANGGNADTVDNFHIWSGTQSQYNAISSKSSTTIYLIKEV